MRKKEQRGERKRRDGEKGFREEAKVREREGEKIRGRGKENRTREKVSEGEKGI